ncbi:hypothetical protein ACIPM2_31825 [Streptomyces sp. NPDC086081]|uniref:hypothetical protein n=1 Tax=Streptomyces sp. NPDC086081 TaxID=3365749 RepID=UPI003824331F
MFEESLAATWQWEGWEEETIASRELARLVDRGHAEGAFDTSIDQDWIIQVLWSLLYLAWQRTREGGAKNEALTLCLRTLRKAVSP